MLFLSFSGLACRLLQVGPRGSKFLGPVLIEVPHVASLRDGDREVVVLRCDSASKGKWTQHVQEKLDDKTLKVQFLQDSDFLVNDVLRVNAGRSLEHRHLSS